MTDAMDIKSAREIIELGKWSGSGDILNYAEAKGYLAHYEQTRPLIDALEIIADGREHWTGPGIEQNAGCIAFEECSCAKKLATEALAKYKASVNNPPSNEG